MRSLSLLALPLVVVACQAPPSNTAQSSGTATAEDTMPHQAVALTATQRAGEMTPMVSPLESRGGCMGRMSPREVLSTRCYHESRTVGSGHRSGSWRRAWGIRYGSGEPGAISITRRGVADQCGRDPG